jgi:hypothetical protein
VRRLNAAAPQRIVSGGIKPGNGVDLQLQDEGGVVHTIQSSPNTKNSGGRDAGKRESFPPAEASRFGAPDGRLTLEPLPSPWFDSEAVADLNAMLYDAERFEYFATRFRLLALFAGRPDLIDTATTEGIT